MAISINKKVCILLSTYNGEKFLEEQLTSYVNQEYQNWYLVAMDDGSNDSSLHILNKFRDKYPSKVFVIQNEKNLGVNKAFEKLIKNAHDFDYYMFSDQDDVWAPEKINVLLSKLIKKEDALSQSTPILIHSDLKVTDQNLNTIYPSFWRAEKLNPHNSKKLSKLLAQNYVVGCSTIFNKSLFGMLKESGIPREVVMHDHWAALIASAFGEVDFITNKTILHRQHDKNDTGVKAKNLWRDLKKLFSIIFLKYDTGEYKKNSAKMVKQANTLKNYFYNSLSKHNLTIINNFIKYSEDHSFNLIYQGYLKSRLSSNLFTLLFTLFNYFKKNKANLIVITLRILASIASFITIVIITNNISQEDSGEFFLYLSYIMPLSIIARFGTDSASSRAIGRKIEINQSFNNIMQLRTIITTFCGSTLLAFILIHVFNIAYDLNYFGESIFVYVFIVLTLLFYSFEKPVCEILLMKGHYLKSQIIQFGIVPIVILTAASILVPNYGFNGALLSFLIGSSLFFLAIIFLDINFNFNLKELIPSKEYINSSVNILLMAIVGLLLTQAFIPLVSFNLTLSEIAVVVIILRLTSLISIYSNILKNSSALFFAKNLELNSYKNINERIRLLILIFLLVAVLYFAILVFFSDFIFSLFGEGYKVDRVVLSILCLSFLITNTTVLYNSVLLLAKKEDILWKISGFSGLISIIIIYFSTPVYGLYGASVGFLLGCLIDFTLQLRLYRMTVKNAHV